MGLAMLGKGGARPFEATFNLNICGFFARQSDSGSRAGAWRLLKKRLRKSLRRNLENPHEMSGGIYWRLFARLFRKQESGVFRGALNFLRGGGESFAGLFESFFAVCKFFSGGLSNPSLGWGIFFGARIFFALKIPKKIGGGSASDFCVLKWDAAFTFCP